ncbi:MAG: ATP-binding protein [Candidatus Methylopumilus sp.]|jgi:hypothetical protein
MQSNNDINIEIIPPDLAIKAMRDSGYQNTAYALSELIDNAAQANAKLIEVFCIEVREQLPKRERKRIKEIVVIDNGDGMDAEVLRMSLQFGNGTHLNDRKGIGRFGMGLPNASISQCRRIDVWSWQNGVKNALHTYLDLDEITQGDLRNVPIPTTNPIPEEWLLHSQAIEDTGTLIIWSKFDEHRLTWKSAKSTIDNIELLVGRMYRKFIGKGALQIRLVALENDQASLEKYALANDPLYLMAPSSTPEPFNNAPMFQKWGEIDQTFNLLWDDESHKVTVRIAWATIATIPKDGMNRGDKPYGKHAAKNIGISIVRADRELSLDDSWAIGYDPTERWWGIEVDFPPALDEIFGVTNNKQAATAFTNMSQFDWKSEADPGESYLDFKHRLVADGDHRVFLLDIVQYIRDQLPKIRTSLADQTKGMRSLTKRHDEVSVEDLATTKFKQRAANHPIKQDTEVFNEAAKQALIHDLVDNKNYSEQVADEMANAVEMQGRQVMFLEKDSETSGFFYIEEKPALTQIIFNSRHPACKALMLALEKEVTEDDGVAELSLRIKHASDTLKMLFAAWARYEIEDVPNREVISEVRQDWGKIAKYFLTEKNS